MLRSWENNVCINKIDPYGGFQWYSRYWLGRRSQDGERQINRWKRIVSRFGCELVKMLVVNMMTLQFGILMLQNN